MRLLMMGPQGAGKGTQAELLSEALSLTHISTGDIFRANVGHKTELGVRAQAYMSRGDLVPDELTKAMVTDRLGQSDVTTGWLLDGFPRNLAQAEWLESSLQEAGTPLTAVLLLDVPDDVLLERMLTRGRADDQGDIIHRRLEIYRTETVPMIDYFGKMVIHVDGVGNLQDVAHRVLRGIGHSDVHLSR
ncbi:MAG: adenylate kinase [Nakamurella sp.]